MTRSRRWTVSSVVCTALIGLFGSTFFAFPEAAEAGPRYTRNQRRWMAKLCAGKDASKPSEIDPCMVSAVKARCGEIEGKELQLGTVVNAKDNVVLMREYAQSCRAQFATNPAAWREPLKYLDVAAKEFERVLVVEQEALDRTNSMSLLGALKPIATRLFDQYVTPRAPGMEKCADEFFSGFLESPTQLIQWGLSIGESILDEMDYPECKRGLPGASWLGDKIWRLNCGTVNYIGKTAKGIFGCLGALKQQGPDLKDLVTMLFKASILKGVCGTLGQIAFDVLMNFCLGGLNLPSTLAKWAGKVAEILKKFAGASNISTLLKISPKKFEYGRFVVEYGKHGKTTLVDGVQNTVLGFFDKLGDKCK